MLVRWRTVRVGTLTWLNPGTAERDRGRVAGDRFGWKIVPETA